MPAFPVGTAVRLGNPYIRTYAEDGTTPADPPGGLVVLLRRPGGDTLTYLDATKDDTGLFYKVVPPSDAAVEGHYQWAAKAGAGGMVLGGKAFDLVDPFAPTLITVEDAKEALQKTPKRAPSDDELWGYVATASEQVEKITGPAAPRTVTDVLQPENGRLRLSTPPGVGDGAFLQVLSASTAAGPVDLAQWTWSLGRVAARTGYVLLPYADYTVTYRVGRQPIPASLPTAARILVQHLWRSQRQQSPSPPGDGLDLVQTPYGFAIPNMVAELLAPYELPPVVA